MDDLLHDLASRVFFWAGWEDRPIRQGRKAASRYESSDVLIRVPFSAVTREAEPYFSRCNSGATRMQHGKPVPRGPRTFQAATNCGFDLKDVVEVTFLGSVNLPATTEVWRSLGGPVEQL
jgi:hypothetical protein